MAINSPFSTDLRLKKKGALYIFMRSEGVNDTPGNRAQREAGLRTYKHARLLAVHNYSIHQNMRPDNCLGISRAWGSGGGGSFSAY